MSRAAVILTRIALSAAFLGAWEFLPRTGIVNPMLLPPLSLVLETLGEILGRGDFREAMLVTSAEVLAYFETIRKRNER